MRRETFIWIRNIAGVFSAGSLTESPNFSGYHLPDGSLGAWPARTDQESALLSRAPSGSPGKAAKTFGIRKSILYWRYPHPRYPKLHLRIPVSNCLFLHRQAMLRPHPDRMIQNHTRVSFNPAWAGRFCTFLRRSGDGTISGCGLNSCHQLGAVNAADRFENGVYHPVEPLPFDPRTDPDLWTQRALSGVGP